MEVPAAAVDPAESVNVLLPAPGATMLVGAKLAVTPAGTPETVNATAELNPLTRAVVKTMGIVPPGARLALVALGVNVIPGAWTVKLRL